MSLTDTELEQLRTALLAQRAALDESRAANTEASATVELDQTRVGRLSRMDALQGQAMSRAAGQRRQQMLVRIESALRRMDAGDYGYCLRCEEEIAPARLHADPAATLCIRCASASEQ
ncbi:TraR/DksA family transcriptional regulator [Thiohalophilus sp.]|uniref:TraR/DksA family transcriptional regulator n=1 Tax=Thiohalophilus sp. TaxID=3028392 RepID=UPI002ACF01D6|nr:TraR/DksA family transcriptional regulator [Thiohalophilus sp.]MDZ7662356.1 TraR/DksA family transcriptional regulator [Thiohalophilus sp.]